MHFRRKFLSYFRPRKYGKIWPKHRPRFFASGGSLLAKMRYNRGNEEEKPMKYCDNHGAPQRDAALPDPLRRGQCPRLPPCRPLLACILALALCLGGCTGRPPPPGTPTRRLAAGLRRQKSRCRRKRPPARRRHPRPPPRRFRSRTAPSPMSPAGDHRDGGPGTRLQALAGAPGSTRRTATTSSSLRTSPTSATPPSTTATAATSSTAPASRTTR